MPEKKDTPAQEPQQAAQDPNVQPAQEPTPENQPVPQSPPSIDGTQPQPQQATDTTVPGGVYVVDGRAVNANNEPAKGYTVVDGKAVKE